MVTVALVRAVGALSLLMLVFIILMLSLSPRFPARLPPPDNNAETGGKGEPVLTIEFMKTGDEVHKFLNGCKEDEKLPCGREDDSAMRQKIRRSLIWDNVLIAAYWLLFVGLSLLLAQRKWPGGAALWLAAFAALCGTGAAISDTTENARALVLLDAEKVTVPLHQTLAAASDEKWLLIGLATLALSPLFLWAGDTRSRLGGGALFLLYLAAGVLIILGVCTGEPGLITAAIIPYLVGLIAVWALFTFGSPWVAQRLRGLDDGGKVL